MVLDNSLKDHQEGHYPVVNHNLYNEDQIPHYHILGKKVSDFLNSQTKKITSTSFYIISKISLLDLEDFESSKILEYPLKYFLFVC